MNAEQYWLIAAIVLFILEVITPGFVLANFGVGAIGAAITAWLGGDTAAQTMTFVVVCLISFVTVRPLLKRTLRHDKQTKTGTEALVGRVGKATEDIPLPPDAGRVQIDGDNWRAMAVHATPIAAGSVVRVVRVESVTVYVELV
jgi:membrane protein implicated in regulation of membrane protease activity